MRRSAVRLILFIAAAVLVVVGIQELVFNRGDGLWEGIACFGVALGLGVAGVLLRSPGQGRRDARGRQGRDRNGRD